MRSFFDKPDQSPPLELETKSHFKDEANFIKNSTSGSLTFNKKKSTTKQCGSKERARWYAKEEKLEQSRFINVIYAEVLCQELCRLIVPHQPKTRILINKERKTLRIISKEVRSFHSLDDECEEKMPTINATKSFDYGCLLICMLWLNDIDVNPDNLGLDHLGRFTKIDGDYSFADILKHGEQQDPSDPTTYTITSATLEDLPAQNKNYRSDVWPIYLVEEDAMAEFKRGVNTAILKITTLPVGSLKEFVDHYVPDTHWNAVFYEEITKRKQMLESAALGSPTFQKFAVNTNIQEIDKYWQYLKEFKTFSKRKPFNESLHYSKLRNHFFTMRDVLADADPAPQRCTLKRKPSK